MEILPIIYLMYMFIAIYFLFLFLLLYFRNKKELFDYPKATRKYSLSIVVPCYNEENDIGGTIEALLKIEYDNLKKIIVVDDCSTDNSYEIIKKFAEKYPKVLAVQTPENSGNAAGAKNYGAEFVDTELIGFTDADSYPAEDSVEKMVGFFDDEKVGAATCICIPRNENKFLEKLQVMEYNIIAFTRKLLGYIDAIYVTPGPLGIYRNSAFKEIGGFDSKNMTEDIEITWHLVYAGYKIKMCLSTYATTTVPNKFRQWYKQRRRWNLGGLQCIAKYKKYFLRKGMLGFFILPFFVLQLFLGLLGISVFVYLVTTRILSNYIFATYSIQMGTPLITMNDLHITTSFLNYLGIILFIVGGIFILLVLSIMKKEILKKHNIFNMLFYSLVYVSMAPFIMITTIYHFIKGNYKWR